MLELIITHGVLSNGANKKIDASVLDELVISDSIPLEANSKKIRQVTVAELLEKQCEESQTKKV